MKKYYNEFRSRGISYIQQKEGRLIGLVTFCVETAYKGRIEVTGKRGRGL
jgi:hypothetical protein